MGTPQFNVEHEYDALRVELSDGKKYVFERPLLIFSVGATIFKLEGSVDYFLPMIINGLLLFNFWFTVNRLGSMSRIIAYIQLVLEDNSKKWHGWESSLRIYRKWLKEKGLKVENIDIKCQGIFDNLGFYPKIYYLHLIMSGLVTVAMSSLFFNKIESVDNLTYLFGSITFLTEIVFILYAANKNPLKLQKLIEQQKFVWEKVIENWNILNIEIPKVENVENKPLCNLRWIGKSFQRKKLIITEVVKSENPTIKTPK